MLYRLRQRAGREEGFTLIELLVVILIIGILAAIAIPSFLNQRGKAYDAAAQELARTSETTAETYATSNNGSYLGMTPAVLQGIEQSINLSTGNGQAYLSGVTYPGGASYEVTVTAANTGDTFSVERLTGGGLSFVCSVGTGSGEPGACVNGTW